MINCVRPRSGTGITSRIEPLFLSDQDKEQKNTIVIVKIQENPVTKKQS